MPAFRNKPVLVAAGRWAVDPLPAWAIVALQANRLRLHGQASRTWWDITTREGALWGEAGDFLIRRIRGETYFCKAPIFYPTSEPVQGCDAKAPSLPRKELPYDP